MDRRASDRVPWFLHPAWVTLMLAMLLQIAVGFYRYGRLEQKVDTLQERIDMLEHLMLSHK